MARIRLDEQVDYRFCPNAFDSGTADMMDFDIQPAEYICQSKRSQLKIVVEKSLEVLYLVVKLVLTKVGFSTRRGFPAPTVDYRIPKSHLSIGLVQR